MPLESLQYLFIVMKTVFNRYSKHNLYLNFIFVVSAIDSKQ